MRPWCWLGGPGVGEVSLCEYAIAAPPPVSSVIGPNATCFKFPTERGRERGEGDDAPLALPLKERAPSNRPTTPSRRSAGARIGSREKPAEVLPLKFKHYPSSARRDASLSEQPVGGSEEGTSDHAASEAGGGSWEHWERRASEVDVVEWTARAAEWFHPVQMLFNGGENRPVNDANVRGVEAALVC